MYAVTDGFSGMRATYNTPGTGANFLVHNMTRMTGSEGVWTVCKGGMGNAAYLYAEAAKKAGCEIRVNSGVRKLLLNGNVVRGVELKDGSEVLAPIVIRCVHAVIEKVIMLILVVYNYRALKLHCVFAAMPIPFACETLLARVNSRLVQSDFFFSFSFFTFSFSFSFSFSLSLSLLL